MNLGLANSAVSLPLRTLTLSQDSDTLPFLPTDPHISSAHLALNMRIPFHHGGAYYLIDSITTCTSYNSGTDLVPCLLFTPPGPGCSS